MAAQVYPTGPFTSSRLFEMLENVQNLENQVSDKIFVQAVRNSVNKNFLKIKSLT